jgi:putative peptidoglycan lipid II flippase
MQEEAKTSAPPKLRRRIPLANVAILLIIAAFIGQLLGFLRTKLVNANFPLVGPESTDAYFAAFTIPDFFFFTLAAGVLGVAFIPVLSDRLASGDRKGMWKVSSSLLNLLTIIMAVVGVVIFVFAEPLVHHIVAPKMGGEQLDTTVFIMRCLALNPLLFTISGILTAVQQTLGRFFFFAIAPLFYNLAIIASIYVFKDTSLGLKGLGIGALAGGVLQLLVVLIGMFGTKFMWFPKIFWRSRDFNTVMHQLPPRSVDQGMDQIQSIAEINLANRLAPGVVSYYNNAYILQTAPTLLIGAAISTAAFPRLTARLSAGRQDLFRVDFLRILRFMIWITIPVVIVAFFARGYLARMIFAQGSLEIAVIFGLLTPAIFFRTIYTIMSRWFYAQKDTKTPLYVSIFTIALNLILVITLAQPDSYGAAGLAIAVSLASAIEVILLGVIMVARDRGLLDARFWGGIFRIVSVSGFSLLTGYIMVTIFPLSLDDRGIVALGSKLAIIAGSTLAVHIAISGLFGLEEARPVFAWIKRLVLYPIRGRAY